MSKKRINIDEDLCVGCGLCVSACHESVIELVDGKAKVVREDYCDGLGNCLPVCPVGAISFEGGEEEPQAKTTDEALENWPIQIKLIPVSSPHFADADLLIAADCTAFAYRGFSDKFAKGKIVLIGCPKLDQADYSEKLAAIFRENSIKSVSVVKMEVPCCTGLERAVQTALQNCGKDIPCEVTTVGIHGNIL